MLASRHSFEQYVAFKQPFGKHQKRRIEQEKHMRLSCTNTKPKIMHCNVLCVYLLFEIAHTALILGNQLTQITAVLRHMLTRTE